MICYILAVEKQHLGPHVVVGYGILRYHHVGDFERNLKKTSVIILHGQVFPSQIIPMYNLVT